MVPNHEVGRSNRPEDTARDSPGERRSAKPPDGFDSRRVSTARRPRDQGSGVLSRQCAFKSRRADGGAHVYGTTEYSFPVRIWLVLRNQSEKLTMRVQVPLPAGALISGRSHGSWPCLVRRWGLLRLLSGGYWFESNHRPGRCSSMVEQRVPLPILISGTASFKKGGFCYVEVQREVRAAGGTRTVGD